MTSEIKRQLRSLGVKPSKGKGQNFVASEEVLSAIVDFGNPGESSSLVEIGPGLGALTKKLVPYGLKAVIEIEPAFCQEMEEKFPQLNVIQADVRTFDFSELGSDLTVFGNLPYVFSTDIIFHLIKHAPVISRAVLLLQREFAERLGASSGNKSYGSITVACQLKADVMLGPIIPGTMFQPPAKVESRVLELKFLHEGRYPVRDWAWLERVVRASFAQRRKKLVNSLSSSGLWSREQILEVMSKLQIDQNARAEVLTLKDFTELAQALQKKAA